MMASVPIGLLVAMVLLANNIRDRGFDASVGISTVTTNKTERQGMTYYMALLASAYVSTILLILGGVLSPFSAVTFLTVPEAYGIAKRFSEKVPLNSDQITAQLALHFGVLVTVGEFINVAYRALLI
jgi:1,4-dihydroxy-2-naphthoate octaprenyltransferase